MRNGNYLSIWFRKKKSSRCYWTREHFWWPPSAFVAFQIRVETNRDLLIAQWLWLLGHRKFTFVTKCKFLIEIIDMLQCVSHRKRTSRHFSIDQRFDKLNKRHAYAELLLFFSPTFKLKLNYVFFCVVCTWLKKNTITNWVGPQCPSQSVYMNMDI